MSTVPAVGHLVRRHSGVRLRHGNDARVQAQHATSAGGGHVLQGSSSRGQFPVAQGRVNGARGGGRGVGACIILAFLVDAPQLTRALALAAYAQARVVNGIGPARICIGPGVCVAVTPTSVDHSPGDNTGVGDCPRSVAFLIVGTPRSGTTLVQRLACELPGVRVPPETHFFWWFLPELLSRQGFPLDAAALHKELRIYEAGWPGYSASTEARLERLGIDASAERLGLDADRVVEDLQGRCDSAADLFSAITRNLAGNASVYGEKTPQHLLWWRSLSRAMPDVRFIVVVRDPRATVCSRLNAPFAARSWVVHAQRWAADQRQALLRCAQSWVNTAASS